VFEEGKIAGIPRDSLLSGKRGFLSGETFSPMRLLLVEDDVRLCRLVKEYLENMGYAVSLAHTGPAGLETALSQTFHAIILDVMLPGMDGFEVLRRLRVHSTVPVLMLTGRGDEADRIVGLEMGADDYLPKTFSTRELLARLRAVIRRSVLTQAQVSGGAEAPVAIGDLFIDPAARAATLAGAPLVLTRQEFDLLLALARAAGRVKTREQLLLDVADRDFEVFDRSIDVLIASLRKKLDDDARAPRWIETIRGVGYTLKRQDVALAGGAERENAT
jgi:DNA-binding response OmpR family regulator